MIAICGDGGFQMVVGELATAVQHRLPIVVIVFNNGVLQNVAVQQSEYYGTTMGSGRTSARISAASTTSP